MDVTRPGSVHDSRILINSDASRVMSGNNTNTVLLHDVGYGITPWLTTNYQNVHTPEQSLKQQYLTGTGYHRKMFRPT